MKSLLKYAMVGAALVLCSAVPGRANVIQLTFEGLQNLEPIENFYNGGTGGLGSTGAPNYGIAFASDSLSLIAGDAGGSGNFNAGSLPSPSTVAFFLSGAGDIMNVAAGFTTGFSFFYSAPVFPGSVTVWSGLNGTGSLLATLPLPLTAFGSPLPYDVWAPIGVAFPGTAESVLFSGTANYIVFDNITLGTANPTLTPEPSTLAIAGLGCLGFVGYALRRHRNAVAA